VAHGKDPAAERTGERETPTVAALADRFMAEHVELKLKPGTAALYAIIIRTIVKPEIGATKADKLTRAAVAKLHGKLKATPAHANRTMTMLASMMGFAARVGILPEGANPVRKIARYPEQRRERFLTTEELERIGAAIREAETTGIAWEVDERGPNARHLVKPENRFTKIDPYAAAALRLLMFTGARLREILHLKWENVDLDCSCPIPRQARRRSCSTRRRWKCWRACRAGAPTLLRRAASGRRTSARGTISSGRGP
jgi:integrase